MVTMYSHFEIRRLLLEKEGGLEKIAIRILLQEKERGAGAAP